MNDYLTPRRRHSSLFQRMEDEINKISRKLSAAKQHRDAHAAPPSLRADSPGLTVRRTKQDPSATASKELTRKCNALAERTNLNLDPKRPPIRRLRFSHRAEEVENLYEPAYDLWQKQEQREGRERAGERERESGERRALEEQLSRMRAVCEQQSFKLGFLRAENREISAQLQAERMDSFREQLYLGKLVEGYRIKVGKYKQILQQEETIDIDIHDL